MKTNQLNRRESLKLGIMAAISSYAAGAKVDSVGISDLDVIRIKPKKGRGTLTYFELVTGKATGFGGALMKEQAMALEKLLPGLRKLLVGKDPRPREIDFEWMWNKLYPDKPLSTYAKGIDPLTGDAIWNKRRRRRHTPTGDVVCALSAVDNALWDVRGKLAGKPVYQLLEGKRQKINAYMSIMPDPDIRKAVAQAKGLFEKGQTAQKWFFRYGPVDGEKGFTKIVGLVEGLRTELGDRATLMFDFAVGSRGRCDWDVPYAIRVAKAIEQFKPKWLEEPFSPEEIDSYRKLKGETNITLATGEHTYSRWNIQPFLDEKLVGYVQCDPEWCGGLSESLRVCELVKKYDGVQYIPHGHHALAAAHVVASQSESLCPMVEHGTWLRGFQRAQTRIITPEKGKLAVPHEPGLGPGIDWERYERA